ncbi:hypothetical protein VTN77DRAFT_5153 [Rasamsonia byssochlamydoides]|uniref:uncharacterized protein n=1 Tax=Rasamsonia byssochlamydoides TaxID=89139 RepID=UPI00374303EA
MGSLIIIIFLVIVIPIKIFPVHHLTENLLSAFQNLHDPLAVPQLLRRPDKLFSIETQTNVRSALRNQYESDTRHSDEPVNAACSVAISRRSS